VSRQRRPTRADRISSGSSGAEVAHSDSAGHDLGPTWALAILIAAVVAAYANGFQADFVFDGQGGIVNNAEIRRLWPPAYLTNNTRPLVYLTFALNYAAGGLSPPGYFAVNLAIHLACAATLLSVVRQTLLLPKLCERYGSRATSLALATALVWAVHPLQTQAVTYLYQRLESLVSLFILLSLYAFIRSLPSGSRRWQAAAIAASAAGMASKELAVVIPILVLWYDRALVSVSWPALWSVRGRFHALLFSTWGWLALLMISHATLYPRGGIGSAAGVTSWEYARSQSGVILHYLRLWFWPIGQCLDYDWPIAETTAAIVLPALAIGGLLGLTVVGMWRRPELAFVGGWFFVLLAPTSSIVPIRDLAFEHRMYLPSCALAVLTVLTLDGLLERLESRRCWWAAIGGIALFLAILSFERNKAYHSEEIMWRNVLAIVPENARGHLNLSRALLRAGRFEEARPHAAEAARLTPDDAMAHNNLGLCLLQQGAGAEAVAHFQRALELDPKMVEAYLNLGNYYSAEQPQQSLALFREAVRIDPASADAWVNLGVMLLHHERDAASARQAYERAIALHPGHAAAHFNVVVLLSDQGDASGAIRHLSTAAQLNPADREARARLEEIRRELAAAARPRLPAGEN
jgi:protein O-mannosyl-transferase